MIDRINLIMRTQNLSSSQFADEIGVQRSSISHILSGRNNPSLEFITKVLTRFPEIETDWLMFGKGTMYRNALENKIKSIVQGKKESVVDEPDLFSQTEIASEKPFFEPENRFENEVFKKEVVVESIQNQSIVKSEQLSEILIKPVEKEEAPEKVIQNRDKRIEKFVILYTDKTFSEYYPE